MNAIAGMSDSGGLRLLLFVHDLEVSKPDSDVVYVTAFCWASYKKLTRGKSNNQEWFDHRF